MKENYITKINKLGKVLSKVIKVMKVFAIISMVIWVLIYALLDYIPKGVISFELADRLMIECDLREFGFIDSEEDKAEREEFNNRIKRYDEYHASDFQDVNVGIGKIELAEGVLSDNTLNENGETIYIMYVKDMTTYMIALLIHIVLTYITLVFAGKLCRALRDCQSPFSNEVISNMQKLAFSLIPWGICGPAVKTMPYKMGEYFSLTVGIDLSLIFVILIILVLAYIFKYGAMLQQESDETL